MPDTPPLEARPAEAFQRMDDRGAPLPQPRARRRDQRDCLGVWVLPVALQDDMTLALPQDWPALAQAMPPAAWRKQGDMTECALSFDTTGWPPGSLALVLMLWPWVNKTFVNPAEAGPLAQARQVAAEVATVRAATLAAAAAAPVGYSPAHLAAAAAVAPSDAALEAILKALAGQGRPGGSLASGLLHLPASALPSDDPVPAIRTAQANTAAAGTATAGTATNSTPAHADATAPPLLRFHLAACLYPGGLFERSARPHPDSLDKPSNLPGPADRSLQRLRALRKACGFSSPVLLAGDQIYADATAGLFDPTLRDEPYKRAYDRLREQDWRSEALALTTPMALMDDHEVVDNWEPSLNGSRAALGREPLNKGRYAFLQRQRHITPDPIDAPRARRSLWLVDTTTLPGHLLFVGDTRSERSARDPARLLQARIMRTDEPPSGRSPPQGPLHSPLPSPLQDPPQDLPHTQHARLMQALRERQRSHPGQIKFVATSSMLLPRRLSTAQAQQAHAEAVQAGRATGPYSHAAALRSDAWCGYPGSMHRLLADLVDEQVQHCVFLSGDEHIGCVAQATVQQVTAAGVPIGQAITLTSVHTGALYAPFPFANSVAADFAEHERFDFQANHRHYRCTVQAQFPSRGDGFVEVVVSADGQSPAREKLSLVFRHGQNEALDACWAPVMG